MQISDEFIVPNLSTPPLPLPDRLPERLPKALVEKVEVKAEITPIPEHIKRDKTETSKPKEEVSKPVSQSTNIIMKLAYHQIKIII